VAVPDRPSLVAVIVALPTATAVTRPLADTVAFVRSELLHVTVRPVSVAPPASRVAAVNCCVLPTVIDAVEGDTVTLATGTAVTVRVACPVLPPAVAVMVVCPVATAVIDPLAETFATVVEDDDQVTVPVGMDRPYWSAPVAVAVAVCPTCTGVAESETETVVGTITGSGGAVGVFSPPPQRSTMRAVDSAVTTARSCVPRRGTRHVRNGCRITEAPA